MEQFRDVEKLFSEAGGALTSKELNAAGVTFYTIKKMLAAGLIERVRRGVYRSIQESRDQWSEIKRIVPQGVFCLYTAAILHELSTFVSSSYQVAIPWKDKVSLPKGYPIDIYYWKDEQYEIGQIVYQSNFTDLTIYDLEKTVCDFVKLRKKVGLDLTKEVLRNYLRRRDRNLHKLKDYANRLSISSVVDQYVKLMV